MPNTKSAPIGPVNATLNSSDPIVRWFGRRVSLDQTEEAFAAVLEGLRSQVGGGPAGISPVGAMCDMCACVCARVRVHACVHA